MIMLFSSYQNPECQLQSLEKLATCKLRLSEFHMYCMSFRNHCMQVHLLAFGAIAGQYDGALSVYTRIYSEAKGKEGTL